MTVEELYGITKVKGLMFEKETSRIYDNYLIANTNRVIGDLFNGNNMERMSKGKAPLKMRPYVSSIEDEINLEEVYVNDIAPVGLAAYFMMDDDMQKYGILMTDYKNLQIQNQKMVSQEIIDGFATNS